MLIFEKFGFKDKSDSKYRLLFQSDSIDINIAFNPYEESFLIEIRRRGGILYPLNNNVIHKLSGNTLPIEHMSVDIFFHNLLSFFQSDSGTEILKGNLNRFIYISQTEIKKYNMNLRYEEVIKKSIHSMGH